MSALTKEQIVALPALVAHATSLFAVGRKSAARELDAMTRPLALTVIEQQAEIERLTAIIAVMDASSPRADHTCAEPGITLSQAVEREYPHLARTVLEGKP